LREAQNANLKWMLEAAAEKLAQAPQQLRAQIRGWEAKSVSLDGEWRDRLDDHAILAECERKQHMAKNA
jgi:hypothetical protein